MRGVLGNASLDEAAATSHGGEMPGQVEEHGSLREGATSHTSASPEVPEMPELRTASKVSRTVTFSDGDKSRSASKGGLSPAGTGGVFERIRGSMAHATAAGRQAAGATTAVLTEASSMLLDEISGCPVTRSNVMPLPAGAEVLQTGQMRRGIFFRQGTLTGKMVGEKADTASDGQPSGPSRESRGRAGDFRQRLDVLLATESSALAVAEQLFGRFEGDLSRLPALLQLLEDRWGFPTRVFPLLWTHIRRAAGRSEDHGKSIVKEEWAFAFEHWLQALRTRCGYTKVSRQCLVHTRHGDDWGKVYLKGAKLGEGSYGEVFLALHAALGVARVVKSVPKSQLSMAGEEVEDEVNMLKSLDHPHIVRVFEAFESSDSLHIVMDFAEGGDLASVIRETMDAKSLLPEAWVRLTTSQVASALDYMHSRGVIHCDLKPGNTMLLQPFSLAGAMQGLEEPHVLLADFGLAEIFDEQKGVGGPTNVKGSPAYLSPEGFEGRLTQKSDTWALGVMVYEMMLGVRPFKGTSNVFLLFCQVANTEPSWDDMPAVPCSLCKALMAKDPKARLSARECFEHEWLAALSTSALTKGTNLQVPEAFGHASYFHRAVMFCMAAGLGMKDMHDLYQLFQALDADNNGQLSLEELQQGLLKLGIQQDPKRLMAVMDLDQDGQISYTEFLAATLRLEEERGDRLMRYAFSMFDLDSDGYISMHELRKLLSGEGPLADVLPDGKTVDEVMEEVSRGEGTISFAHFRSYLLKSKPGDNWRKEAKLTGSKQHPDYAPDRAGGERKSTEDYASDLLEALDEVSQKVPDEAGSSEEEEIRTQRTSRTSGVDANEELIGFHLWLEDLFRDKHHDARLTGLLTFRDRRIEAAYVSHYFPATCRQTQLLSLCVIGYSAWAVTTEGFNWDPSFADWSTGPLAANNTAWLMLFLSAMVVIAVCAWWLRRHKRQKKETEILQVSSPSNAGRDAKKAPSADVVEAEAAIDAEAVFAERLLCVWTIAIPWLACFFANRRRLAALYGVKALEAFPAVSTDYDLIMTILGTLMFYSMRTNLCFVHALPMVVSALSAYFASSLVMQLSPQYESSETNWGWVAVLLVVSCALCLSGHRNLEYHRRLSFLSLYSSYGVLKDMQLEDPRSIGLLSPSSDAASPCSTSVPETRMARLKRGIEVLRRLSENTALGNQALRNSLQGLLEVLQSTRDDVAQADLRLSTDLSEQLQQKGIEDHAQQMLLDLFETAPPVPRLPLDSFGLPRASVSTAASEPTQEEKVEAWGWHVLESAESGGSTSSTAPAHHEAPESIKTPLASAGEALLLPAASEAAGGNAGLGRSLLQALMDTYRSSPVGAEARAALALRASHWISRQIGLWQVLTPWERVALLTAAAGLHCAPMGAVKALGFHSEQTIGCFVGRDPLLGHAASAATTMLAIKSAGLGRAGSASATPEGGQLLWELVRRLQSRARPASALEELKRVRALLEDDDGILPPVLPQEGAANQDLEAAATERRLLLAGLVLAAADLAFLALPPASHKAWAELVCEETEAGIYASSWIRGLIEVLAMPIYETLRHLSTARSRGKSLVEQPLKHLRYNARHWKDHPLRATDKSNKARTRSELADGESQPEASKEAVQVDAGQATIRTTASASQVLVSNVEASLAQLPGQVIDEEKSRKSGSAVASEILPSPSDGSDAPDKDSVPDSPVLSPSGQATLAVEDWA
eukprot:TRINITY_DN40607_c0_g1_i1.p1 TRINITY_DN40607_c0_g1~~TRINITY_DN40607_c0_g1_i1.p1  ORF type:complete len:1713 (+),score=346.86 TRINITY_DN40607_c0_g1_i1:23-5140(+)